MTDTSPERIEIRCKALFDGKAILDDARVVVEGAHIISVEPNCGPPTKRPAADDRVGTFLMPGLVDSHVHVCGYHEGLPAGQPFEPVKHFLRLCIANGVTTLRDTGNALETIFYAREWAERYDGPRVFSAGPLLDVPPLTWAFSRIVRDSVDARREVGRLADEGVDLIKAYRRIAPEQLAAIIEAARERDLPVAVDSQLTPVRDSSRLGARSLEHMANIVDPDTTSNDNGDASNGPAGRSLRWSHVEPGSDAVRSLGETLVEHGTFVVPTLLVSRRWTFFDELVGDPHLGLMAAVMPYHRHLTTLSNPMGAMIGKRFVRKYMPIAELSRPDRRKAARGLELMGEVMCAYHAAGVKFAAGTDSPNPSLAPGFSLHQELAEMVRRGLTPLNVLSAATSAAGALLRRSDLGVIKPGALADLLVIDGRPDRTIEELGRIQAVMKNGRWVDHEAALAKVAEAAADL
jgi:cytosine/adenosine deaminase-related metal-dependent hydrolase